VNPPQPLAFFKSASAARSVGYYLSIRKSTNLDVLVSACENNLVVIASLNSGHTHYIQFLNVDLIGSACFSLRSTISKINLALEVA